MSAKVLEKFQSAEICKMQIYNDVWYKYVMMYGLYDEQYQCFDPRFITMLSTIQLAGGINNK